MGLDMYLNKKTYIPKAMRLTLKIDQLPEDIGVDPKRVQYIGEEVGVWRKANAIHKWFVDNTQEGNDQNGVESAVSKEQLGDLMDLVCRVLDNHKLAPELLPTTSGFFFGSTEYDEYYFNDLELTKKILSKVLKEVDDGDYYYQSSW